MSSVKGPLIRLILTVAHITLASMSFSMSFSLILQDNSSMFFCIFL